jgi:murein DD-endopeptidase MepM/ murein hydrolase activator NlpD
MAGAAPRSVPEQPRRRGIAAGAAALLLLMAVSPAVQAQALYKYRGDNGEWIFSDRPPPDGSRAEVRELESSSQPGVVTVDDEFVGRTLELTASNDFHAPVELKLTIERIRGLEFPDAEDDLHWILPPRSRTTLVALSLLENQAAPVLQYSYRYLPGDPAAEHAPPGAYRVPFAIASNYPVSQAFPEVITHTSPDSYHAIDLAMPIGTDIFAARDGIVFDVASGNFGGGLDAVRDGPKANVVRILHDDGTYAVYAHLNWNSIRVRPGDRVRRGEYIAESGNTGFSSGPHLHFAVLRNIGMQVESVPVSFQGPTEAVWPATGMTLTAY